MQKLNPFTWIFVWIGARFWWLFRGKRIGFEEEMTYYYSNDTKFIRNYFTGVALMIILVGLVLKFFRL